MEELFQQGNRDEAFFTLVEIAITSEISDVAHSEEIFSMAVALICELGLAIQGISAEYPDEISNPEKILGHVATYLLSVSNSSNNCIRLSLINYFGETEKGLVHKQAFNRIMGRFGHTILEHLFTLLFSKKTEAIALQYLLENIPFVLEADNHSQKILHETWKFYMLKRPERFALFLQILSEHIKKQSPQSSVISRKVFLQHLGLLLKVASEVNHKDLGREIMCSIVSFEDEPFKVELINRIVNDSNIRDTFRKLIIKLTDSANASQVIDDHIGFRSSKRGRKPSFAKSQELGTLHQVAFLGHRHVARAS